MKKYLILLLVFPFILNAQDRVSDIKTFGVSSILDMKDKVGFAEINGIQYMLKEHQQLFIYRIENDSLILIDSVALKSYYFN